MQRGIPVFVLLVDGNKEYTKEELAIESKYRPRTTLEDDENRIGRVGVAAVAADFNGDGKMDLYVVNQHYGVPYQTDATASRIYPTKGGNVGRKEKKEPYLMKIPPFLGTPIKHGLNNVVDFGEKPEREGRNSLYINLGDRDGDGIPEWEDQTDQVGVGGLFSSLGATVADVDRDGDLDIYVGNLLDPDFLGFGMTTFARNRNQLYINQLVETGTFHFREVALEMEVSGLYKEENLPHGSYAADRDSLTPRGKSMVNGYQVGEEADHTVAAQFTDWNDDGWPDLVVANDMGGTRLRIYENIAGKNFRRITDFDDPRWEGSWMGVRSEDLDGDGHTEILITSCGTQVMEIKNTSLFIGFNEDVHTHAVAQMNYPLSRSTMHPALLSYLPMW